MVIWTDTALTDLTGFIDTAKKTGTEMTMKEYLKKLVDYVDILDDMKELGTEINDFYERLNLRQIIYKKHKVVYSLKDDNVYIITIVHTKMDFCSAIRKVLKNGGK